MRRSFKYLLAFSLLIGGVACGDDDGDTEPEESGTADTGDDNPDSDSTDNSNDNSDAGANNNNNDTGSATDPVTCAAAGDYSEVVTVGGLEQPFQVHIPDNLEDGAVVVIQLHGLGEDVEDIDAITELTVRADEEGFVVATPLGAAGPSGNAWNAGSCCDSTGADHVAALSAVIDATLELSVCGDEDSVFVAGQSNGAMMAQRMGCQTSAAVAGIISNAGFLADESGGSALFECDDYQPTPILHVHGLMIGGESDPMKGITPS
ncbi:MAG: PHB depolymerase family esterase [Myxococcota bacterium]